MRVGRTGWYVALASAVAALVAMELIVGSTRIPFRSVLHVLTGDASVESMERAIVIGIRLPQALTALLAGAGLACGGLLMQTVFRNPLAGPTIMGVSSGASLGVALLMLAQPMWAFMPVPQDLGLLIGAMAGAMAVLFLVMAADHRIGDGVTLLIVGLLVGYLCAAVIGVLEAMGSASALKGFVLWGLGSFAGVSLERIPWLAAPVVVGLVLALLFMKPLNALLMGEDYAATMGVHARRTRRRLLWITGIMAGAITAFCGPIAFIGMITPHMARAAMRSSDHAVLLPVTMLMGSALALGCDLIARSAITGGVIPLNAVTSLLGVPVVAWVLLAGKRWTSLS